MRLSRTKKLAIKKAKDLGFSYDQISRMFGVSISTVSYWVHHNMPEDGMRTRPLRYTVTKTGVELTREPYKRPKPPKCELCGLDEPTVYHTWDRYRQRNDRAVAGLWLCPGCHWIAEKVDKDRPLGGYDQTTEYREYILLREKAEKEVADVTQGDRYYNTSNT